ncbi:MAG: hypothetical protein R3C53_21965 [Pirellulaceae bacterium]
MTKRRVWFPFTTRQSQFEGSNQCNEKTRTSTMGAFQSEEKVAMHRISDPQICKTLKRLHREASSQTFVMMKGLAKSIFGGLTPENMQEAYLAISKQQGEYLYDLRSIF